jgi:hypothetical protein
MREYIDEEEANQPTKPPTIPSAQDISQRAQERSTFLASRKGVSEQAQKLFRATADSLPKAQIAYAKMGMLLDNVKGKLAKDARKEMTEARRLMEDYWGLNQIRILVAQPKSKNAVVVPPIKAKDSLLTPKVSTSIREPMSPFATVVFERKSRPIGRTTVVTSVPIHTYYGVKGMETALTSNLERLIQRVAELQQDYDKFAQKPSTKNKADSTLRKLQSVAAALEEQLKASNEMYKQNQALRERAATAVERANELTQRIDIRARTELVE